MFLPGCSEQFPLSWDAAWMISCQNLRRGRETLPRPGGGRPRPKPGRRRLRDFLRGIRPGALSGVAGALERAGGLVRRGADLGEMVMDLPDGEVDAPKTLDLVREMELLIPLAGVLVDLARGITG